MGIIMSNSAVVKETKREIDILSGSVWDKILMFTIPIAASSILQQLFNAADVAVVGKFASDSALAAVGSTSSLINLIINLFVGLSVGANVIISRFIGQEDAKNASLAAHSSVALAIVCGLIMTVLGQLIAVPALEIMSCPSEVIGLATLYMRIYFLGMPFMMLYNFCYAILRSRGDTKRPLYGLTASGIINVILNLFFVLVCGMSVEGMALASTISNAVSAVLLLVYLVRSEGPCRLNIKRLGIEKRAFLGILHIGLPAGIQSSLFSLSHMVIQSSIVAVNNAAVPEGSAFQPVVKGSAAGTSIESFGYTAVNSTAQAAISFTGQNVGAGNFKRVVSVRRACYIAVSVFSVIFAAVMLSFRGSLLALYGVTSGAPGSLDRIAYDTAVTRMLYMFIPYFLLGFMEVGSGVMQGLGCSVTSSTVTLLGSVAFRILWIATAFRAFPRLEIVFLSYPISWFLTAAAQYVCSQVVLKKRMSAAAANVTAAAPSSAELQP